MTKIKNDPSSYRKRADFAKLPVGADGQQSFRPLPKEACDQLIDFFRNAKGPDAAYVPFRRIVEK